MNCLDCNKLLECKNYNPNACELFQPYIKEYLTYDTIASLCGISLRTFHRRLNRFNDDQVIQYIKNRANILLKIEHLDNGTRKFKRSK